MGLEIAPFTPELASPDELRAWHTIFGAVSVADFPSLPVPTYDTFVRQLLTPASHGRLHRRWDARDHGRLLGTAKATFLTDENSGYAIIAVRVSAQDRRRGVGTKLLRAMLPEIHEHGCRTISGEVKAGTDSEKWTNALGFRTVLQLSSHHLDIKSTDPALWQVEPAPGFRLRQWIDTAPDDVVEGFVRARNAMADQPIGEANYRLPVWTVERVRQHEAEVLKTGESRRYVVAVEERSGTVAGFTEIAIVPEQWSHCRQVDTAVLSEFRGLGLGRAMKASMMQWLTTDLPGLNQVHTTTATDNPHMIRVNTQLGYETDYTIADVEAEIGAVEALLDSSGCDTDS